MVHSSLTTVLPSTPQGERLCPTRVVEDMPERLRKLKHLQARKVRQEQIVENDLGSKERCQPLTLVVQLHQPMVPSSRVWPAVGPLPRLRLSL